MLWDIDGTLLSSAGSVARTFLDAAEEVCGRRPDPNGLDFGGRLDPEIAELLVLAAGAHISHSAAVLARFEDLVVARDELLRAQITSLPGVTNLVAVLADSDVIQTVVTGNLESVGRLKLEAAGLTPPLDITMGGFGASGISRAAVAQFALDRLSASGWVGSPDTCWVIGDTPRDLECARAVGARCVLVATGQHPIESLGSLGADLVLPTLESSDALRGLWFG